MENKMYKLISIILLTFILTISITAKDTGPKTGIISEDLRHELKTQEVILERIIKHYDKNRIINHYNITSYYIENFGALFELQRFPTSESNIFNQFGTPDNRNKTKYIWSEDKNAIVKFESKHSIDDSLQVIKMVDSYVQDIHLAVFEFFADYMNPVNWLKENEKVCVHFDLNLYRKIPKEYNRAMVENIVPLSIQASVSTGDIKLFQKGELSIDQFDKQIKIEKILMNAQSYNYNILGDVIESTARSVKEGKERPFSLYTTSIKISDLGVLYFLVAQHKSERSFNDVGSIFEYLFGMNSDDEEMDENDIFEKSFNELKTRLATSVGQYAHQLKDLNENQWIVLLANIGSNYGGFKSRFVMKIQKKNVDQYENNMISLEEYLKHIEIYEDELYLK